MSGHDDDTEGLGPEEADAALAAEYVLRLLPPAEEAAARARAGSDPVFAALVADWQARFAVWNEAVAPVPPSPGLRRRVKARVFGPRPSLAARLWASAGFWRGAAGIAAAAAVVLAVVALRAPAPPTAVDDVPRLISAAAGAGGEPGFIALVEPQAAVIRVARLAAPPDPGRAHQLWFVPEGAAPVSLGVLPDAAAARVELADELVGRLATGGAIAVSDEPAGGSPTGAPTGPVIAAGPLREL